MACLLLKESQGGGEGIVNFPQAFWNTRNKAERSRADHSGFLLLHPTTRTLMLLLPHLALSSSPTSKTRNIRNHFIIPAGLLPPSNPSWESLGEATDLWPCGLYSEALRTSWWQDVMSSFTISRGTVFVEGVDLDDVCLILFCLKLIFIKYLLHDRLSLN